MCNLFRLNRRVHDYYLIQAKYLSELIVFLNKTKHIRRLENIFPVWKKLSSQIQKYAMV